MSATVQDLTEENANLRHENKRLADVANATNSTMAKLEHEKTGLAEAAISSNAKMAKLAQDLSIARHGGPWQIQHITKYVLASVLVLRTLPAAHPK